MLLNTISELTKSVNTLFSPPSELCNLLLYGSKKLSDEINHEILVSSIRVIKATKRLKEIEAYDTNA